MNQPSNNKSSENPLNFNSDGSVVSKPVKYLGDLDSIFLEKAYQDRDAPALTATNKALNFTPEKALYIAEIEGKFCFLDYTNSNTPPIPIPIETSSFDTISSTNSSATASNWDLAKKKIDSSSPSLFWGKKALFIGMGLGILLSFGATRLFSTSTATDSKESEVAEVAASAPAQTVTVTEVSTTDINSTLDVSGTVTAYEQTPAMSQASGLQITEVLAERGDFVERGQVLARLNNRALIAQKNEAEAAVAQAQAKLSELKAGSRAEEIAQAQSRVDNAKSAIAQIESDLELTQKRLERNRTLQAEGAITRDRLDEVVNQERVAQSNLAGAKANLAEAQQALAQLKAGSRPETIAQSEAELKQAQARLQSIEAQLADTTVVAPSRGVIASRDARVGQITSTSETLFTIIQDGRLELRLKVPETLISKIQQGQKVQISSNANSDLNLTGKVREIDPIIDDSSRQALVKVDLPSNSKLKPGMFLQADINIDTNKGQAVPIEALLPQSGNSAIAFVVQDDNTVKAQTVEMGEIISEDRVEVIAGLESGDRIVLKGAAYLKDGDRVAIANN